MHTTSLTLLLLLLLCSPCHLGVLIALPPPLQAASLFEPRNSICSTSSCFAYRYTWEAAVLLTVPLGGSRSSTAPLQAACLVAPSCGHCPGAPAASAPLPASGASGWSGQLTSPEGGSSSSIKLSRQMTRRRRLHQDGVACYSIAGL
jgi:hypothetical protein